MTLRKPIKGASIDTMKKWIKHIFTVDNVFNFSPHSCWGASSSKTKPIDVNIDEMIRKGRCKNKKNFFRCFDEEITEYVPADIDFIRICRVWNNVKFLYSVSN